MAASQPRLTAKDTRAALPEIACLEEYWAGALGQGPQLDEMIGRTLLDTLGLGNQQVIVFLHGERPSFERFCAWIIDTVGPPDSLLLSRYHGWLTERPAAKAARAGLARIAEMPPVLNADALADWDRDGYVILRQAISPAEIAAVRTLIWQTIGASPDDPESWYHARSDGIMIPYFQHPALEAARRSERIHKAFAQLWGTEKLWVTIDRMGFNPPVRADHRFAGSDIHWDCSLARPIPFATQAVLYLTDTTDAQGAFRCVPGFHRRIDVWLDGLGDSDPRAVDLSAEEHRVAGRAGDLVIWRQDLPHAASPNTSGTPRLVQYLNYYSPDLTIRSRWL